MTEDSETGEGFLADVAQEWEQACAPALEAGIRVVNARLGLVISPQSGALSKMLFPAKLFGGKLGSGNQWMSWIALDDCVGAMYHALMNDSVAGKSTLFRPIPFATKTLRRRWGAC